MKVISIKSIYLSERELKQAICEWLHERGRHDLATHLADNLCEFEWSHEYEGDYLAISIDGTFNESE